MLDPFSTIPRSLVPFLLGVGTWCGINYVGLTSEIYKRITLPYREEMTETFVQYRDSIESSTPKQEIRAFVDCLYLSPLENEEMRRDLVVYFSSLGQLSLNGSALDDGIKNYVEKTYNSGECGALIWRP